MTFQWSPEQTKARSRWERSAARWPKSPARALRWLAETGLLHPDQARAAHYHAVVDVLAAGGADSSSLFMAHAHLWGGWQPLRRFAPELAAALAKNEPLLALAATEPASGADVFSLGTTARRTREGWVLSGRKSFITNASLCTHALVLARPTESKHPQDLACFLVPARSAGLSRRPQRNLVGPDGADVGELRLSRVRVPESALVGHERQGAEVFRWAMAWERSLILAGAPAALERLAARLEAEAAGKVRGGRPLAEQPRFRAALAEVRADAAAMREQVAEAARALDEGRNTFLLSTRVKLEASRRFERASRRLLALAGKDGFVRGSPYERNFRDSLASSLYSGANDLLAALLEEVS